MKRDAAVLLTTFGLGHLRPARGTWGSMPTAGLAWVLIVLGFGPASAPIVYHAALAFVFVAFSAICIAFGSFAETRFDKKDPGQVVADETAGQCIPLVALPGACEGPLMAMACVGGAFIAFRILDILKLPPARRLQALPAGWGILIDDVIAGVQALVIMQVILRLAV